jgi:hypothetical protein
VSVREGCEGKKVKNGKKNQAGRGLAGWRSGAGARRGRGGGLVLTALGETVILDWEIRRTMMIP